MRLNLRDLIHTPGACAPFSFSMDLSDLDFFGAKPIVRPVEVSGQVRNRAGAMMLEGTAASVLDLVCDRCGAPFSKVKSVAIDTLLAAELAGEESDDIVLLDGSELDVGELASTAFILDMDTKNLCSENCLGLCAGCGADLNQGPCSCKPEPDPRLAALAKLLEQDSE